MHLRMIAIATGLILLPAGATSAAQSPLTTKQIRASIAGKTLYLATPIGTELPIRFYSNGTVSGRAGALAKHLSHKKTVRADRGRWWTRANRLCKRWRTWFDGRTHCFRLKKTGRTILWRRDDGKTGRARIGG